MNFENIQVGDEVVYSGKITKVIMKDQERMVCDISDNYIKDWGCLNPVEITDVRLLYAGYTRGIRDANLFLKTIYRKGTMDKIVECHINKTEDGYLMHIHCHPDNKIGELNNVKVKYLVEIARLEEAFRIVASEKL